MKEPFYFSLSFKKIYYTQASILHSIAKRSLSIYDGSFLNEEKQKCILTMELKSHLKKATIDKSKVLAQFSQQSTNRQILKYPIQLIQMSLKNVYQLDFLIPDFDPSNYQEFRIIVKAYKDNGEAVEVGNLVIDPNVFITLYKQQDMSYYQVNQRLFKQSKNQITSQIDRKVVDVVITYELGVAKTRFALQKAFHDNKKGINISQFKQTLRKFHLIKNNQEEEDFQLPNQSVNKQYKILYNEQQIGNKNEQSPMEFQYKIQVISPQNDRQSAPKKFKIEFQQRLIMEKAANKQAQISSQEGQKNGIHNEEQQVEKQGSEQFQSIKQPISQRFKNFLRKKIEPQLKYINPSKQKTQEVFNTYYKQASNLKQLEESLVKQTNSRNLIKQNKVGSSNKETCNQKLQINSKSIHSKTQHSHSPQKDQTTISQQKKHDHFPNHKKAGNWFQQAIQSLTQNGFFKIKILLFIIFSLFVLNIVMNPSRKVRPQTKYVTEYEQNYKSYLQQFQNYDEEDQN